MYGLKTKKPIMTLRCLKRAIKVKLLRIIKSVRTDRGKKLYGSLKEKKRTIYMSPG